MQTHEDLESLGSFIYITHIVNTRDLKLGNAAAVLILSHTLVSQQWYFP